MRAACGKVVLAGADITYVAAGPLVLTVPADMTSREVELGAGTTAVGAVFCCVET